MRYVKLEENKTDISLLIHRINPKYIWMSENSLRTSFASELTSNRKLEGKIESNRGLSSMESSEYGIETGVC